MLRSVLFCWFVSSVFAGCASLFFAGGPDECRQEYEVAPVTSYSSGGSSDSLLVTVLYAEREQPLPEAWVRNGERRMQTNEDGQVRLRTPVKDTLRVDYVGFQRRKFVLPSNASRVVVNVPECIVELREPF
jgi:hypothetical protein